MHTDIFIIEISFSVLLTHNSELQTKGILSCFVGGKAGISPSITLGERVDEQRVHSSLSDQHLVSGIWEHRFAIQEPRQVWSW